MTVSKPEIVITYCTQCQWLLRAAWLAQELLSTFGDDLGKVSLVPGTGGVFHIYCDTVQIWERKADGGFPCLLYTSPSPRDGLLSRMPSSA